VSAKIGPRFARKLNRLAKRFYFLWFKMKREENPKAAKAIQSLHAGITSVSAQFADFCSRALLPKEAGEFVYICFAGFVGESRVSFSIPPGVWSREQTRDFFENVEKWITSLPDAWFAPEEESE